MVADAPSLSSETNGESVAKATAPKFDASGIVITEEYFAPIEATRLTQRVEARLRDNLTSVTIRVLIYSSMSARQAAALGPNKCLSLKSRVVSLSSCTIGRSQPGASKQSARRRALRHRPARPRDISSSIPVECSGITARSSGITLPCRTRCFLIG